MGITERRNSCEFLVESVVYVINLLHTTQGCVYNIIHVFNISKSIRILRNIKKLGNFGKSARKCAPNDLFTFESNDVIPGKQTREQAIEVLSETLHNT